MCILNGVVILRIYKGGAMFNVWKARLYGQEAYGQIISIQDVLNVELIGTIRPSLPQKKLCVKYQVNGREYYKKQRIYNVLSKHEETLKVGNYIRIRIYEADPRAAYINEFDYPEYQL